MLKYCVDYKAADGYEYPYSNILVRAIWYLVLNILLKNRLVAVIARELSLTGNTLIGIKSSSPKSRK
jgi:hypothetical protein